MGVGGRLGSFNGRPDIKYVNITIYYILFYTTFNKNRHLAHTATIQRPYTGQIEGINEMFIGISVAFFSTNTPRPDEYVMRYFDANRITLVGPARIPAHVEFWFDDGSAEPSVFMTDSYDEGGLIELIMQARLRPAEFLPSLYVGKKAKAEDGPNNVQWSAKDNA